MSLVIDIIAQGASIVSDPRQQAIDPLRWLQLYNNAMEWVCRRFRVIERDATFDFEVAEERYPYPDDETIGAMVQMRRLQYSPTPTDRNSYRPIRERAEHKARRSTEGQYPQGEPWFYWSRTNYFQVYPQPTETVAASGLISYWSLPIPVVDVVGAVFELPPKTRLIVVDLVGAFGKRELNRFDEAQAMMNQIERELAQFYDKIEDMTDDANDALTVPGQREPGRMV
jgi:hypothetical protein